MIVFVFAIYGFLIVLAKQSLEETLGYLFAYDKFLPISAENYINNNKEKLATKWAFIFPLTYCFLYGAWYAKKAYNILTEDKDENRIASWLF